jgi:ATP-binding cassette, subfamily C, bacterial exporter for protease/lipase
MTMFLNPDREIDAVLLRYRHLFLSLFVFSGIINLLMLVPSIYAMQVFNRVMASRNLTTLALLLLITLLFFLMSGVLEWIRHQMVIRMSVGIDRHLATRAFTAAFQRNLRNQGGNPSQVISDLTTLRQFITGQGVLAILEIPWIPIFLIACFLLHPWLGWFATAGAILHIIIAVWNEMATKKQMEGANHLSVNSSVYVNSALKNAEVIQAMGMLETLKNRWHNLNQRIINAQADASIRSSFFTTLVKTFRFVWIVLSMTISLLLIVENQISPGAMIAVGMILSRALAPIETAVMSWKQMDNARASYQRLNHLLASHPLPPERMALPAPQGEIRLEGVSVTPPGRTTPAVKGVSLGLAPGEVLAIVGQSASGKSSLIRAMIGVWPASEGTIRYDQADLALWPRDSIGPHIGYLPQDVEIFDGTVAENIARFGATDSEKVIAAAQMASIHEMILYLEEGYDTRIGSGGTALSGGQRQRLGLARALYAMPRIVALDEPNSNLDEAGEIALIRAIEALKAQGSTVIIVTHRTNILRVVDKMLLLKAGEVQLYGPRDLVLKALVAPPPTRAANNPADSTAATASNA